MKTGHFALPGLVAAAAIIGGVVFLESGFADRSDPELAGPIRSQQEIPLTSPPAASPEAKGDIVRDVDVNGRAELDADGNLKYTPALRDLFDHFLTLAGDQHRIDEARVSLERHLQASSMPAAAISDALGIFDLYVEYLDKADDIAINEYEADDMAYAFGLLADLRRSVLGRDVAEAFFAEDEARERYLTEQRRISRATEPGSSQRRQQLDALEQTLPPDLQQGRQQALAVVSLRERTKALRVEGASEEAIHYMREEQLGTEAAQRLKKLDEQRADWDDRIARYRQEQQAVLDSAGLSAEDRDQQLKALGSHYFSEQEMRRVRALDRLASSK